MTLFRPRVSLPKGCGLEDSMVMERRIAPAALTAGRRSRCRVHRHLRLLPRRVDSLGKAGDVWVIFGKTVVNERVYLNLSARC